MNGAHALTTRAASPDDILQLLQNDYLTRAAVDPEVDSGETLTREMSILEWRDVCDLISLRRLVPLFNEWFETAIPDEAFHKALTPENERTLGDFCDLVAPAATLPVAHPIRIAGSFDRPAGVFFAIRTLLSKSGVPSEAIRPSTSFTAIDTRYIFDLAKVVQRIGGAAVGSVTIRHNTLFRDSWLVGISGGVMSIFGVVSRSALFTPVGLALAVAGAIGVAAGRRRPPAQIMFGNAHTFGDLSRAIARNAAS